MKRQGFVEHPSKNPLFPHIALPGEDVTDDLVTVEVGSWPSFTEAEGKSLEVERWERLQDGYLSELGIK